MLLLDGTHMLRRGGTGIASYARSLASTFTSADVPIALLLDRRVLPAHDLDAIGVANQVFGNLPSQSRFAWGLELALRSRFGLSRYLAAQQVDTTMMRLASMDPPLPAHDALFNVSNGMGFADGVFTLRSRITEVTVPTKVMLAHWTEPAPIRIRSAPNVYTMHDVIPLQMPHLVLDRPGLALRRFRAVAGMADHIVAVSERAREDIIATLGISHDRISTTYQPVPEVPQVARESSERLVRDVYAVEPGDYAFFCGAIEPKKNLYRLIEAFSLAGIGLKLLIAGPLGWLYDDIVSLLDQFSANTILPPRRQVRWVGYLPRLHLTALMQCARFFAFPSIYEGFGLPVAEAMQLGVPVLTSSMGGLKEVAGDAALMVNPLDINDIARKIRLIANDGDLRQNLATCGPVQAAKFSRAAHLEKLAMAYRSVGVTIPAKVPPKIPLQTGTGTTTASRVSSQGRS